MDDSDSRTVQDFTKQYRTIQKPTTCARSDTQSGCTSRTKIMMQHSWSNTMAAASHKANKKRDMDATSDYQNGANVLVVLQIRGVLTISSMEYIIKILFVLLL
jgi:hypothetical protein